MDVERMRSVLNRIQAIRHACDLALLLFVYRHPCALITSEQLAAYVGYDRERIAKSLDALIDAGLLTRSQNPTHAARLYVLVVRGLPGGVLSSLLEVAATRQGRQDLMRLLEPARDRAREVEVRPTCSVTRIA